MLQPLVARPASRADDPARADRRRGRRSPRSTSWSSTRSSVAITSVIGHWTPDRPVAAGALLALAVVIVAFISAARLGLADLDRAGDRGADDLRGRADRRPARPDRRRAQLATRWRTSPNGVSWALPFEAIYQSALHALTADTTGVTGTHHQPRPVRRRQGRRRRPAAVDRRLPRWRSPRWRSGASAAATSEPLPAPRRRPIAHLDCRR